MERRKSPWSTILKGKRTIRQCEAFKDIGGPRHLLFHSQYAVSSERVSLNGLVSGEVTDLIASLYIWPVNGIVNFLFIYQLPQNLYFCRSIQIPLFKLLRPILAFCLTRGTNKVPPGYQG